MREIFMCCTTEFLLSEQIFQKSSKGKMKHSAVITPGGLCEILYMFSPFRNICIKNYMHTMKNVCLLILTFSLNEKLAGIK